MNEREEIEELLLTLINGNIIDYQRGVADLSLDDTLDLIEHLRENSNCYSPEFIIRAFSHALLGIKKGE